MSATVVKPVCQVPSDWPDQVIRCKHCGLPISRIDLPAPEGPSMKGIHGWTHNGIGPIGPPRNVGDGDPKDDRTCIAEPSDYIAEIFRRAFSSPVP